MCGIIGIIGREAAAPQLVEALKRLEYRGYDSAGVATLEGGKLARRRAEGKLKNLESRLAREPLQGTIGIGHTRWATHGRPTENNAHPHATEKVAVVHNGIIENFAELRRELEQEGVKFSTDTDTEVIAHLVTEEMKHGASPVAAVQAALPRLRGAFAVYRPRKLPRRRRLGDRHPLECRDSRQRRQTRATRRDQIPGLDAIDRQGQPSPLHGEGNP